MPKIRTHYDDKRCFLRTSNSVSNIKVKTKCKTESCGCYNEGSGKRYCSACMERMYPKKLGVINNLCS